MPKKAPDDFVVLVDDEVYDTLDVEGYLES